MRKKARNKGEAAKLEMTPMIDVVFQLLIFFIVTLKQEDILSHLDVSRPASDSAPPPEVQPELLTVMVYRDGYIMNGRRLSRASLDRRLTKISTYSKDVSVVIKCMPDSPHAKLINLLDICAKNGLENLSVFSM
jgi:biopolymer transport protein ExbD